MKKPNNMQSQEWLESKKIDIGEMCPDVVDMKDALVAIEMAKLEAKIEASILMGTNNDTYRYEKYLKELKTKHNIL